MERHLRGPLFRWGREPRAEMERGHKVGGYATAARELLGTRALRQAEMSPVASAWTLESHYVGGKTQDEGPGRSSKRS